MRDLDPSCFDPSEKVTVSTDLKFIKSHGPSRTELSSTICELVSYTSTQYRDLSFTVKLCLVEDRPEH